jgi:hypothetical protein
MKRMTNKKIIMNIGGGNIVAEQFDDNITIYYESNGKLQDIVMVQQSRNDMTGEIYHDQFDCMLWTDSDSECFTEKLEINRRIFEEDA